MIEKRSQDLKLSAAHLQAIGEVASEWSAFEFSFQSAMSMISKVPMPIVIAFTAPTPMYVWIDIIQNLMHLDDSQEKSLKDLKAIFEQIRKVQTKRNTIVHAVWCQQFESDLGKTCLDKNDKAFGLGFPKKIEKGLINQFSYTSDEMNAVASEIRQLNDKFRSIFWPKSPSDKSE